MSTEPDSSQRNDGTTCSLLHYKIGISISEHEPDLAALGLRLEDVNEYTVLLQQTLVANEGTVVLGHDWRDDGVMRRVIQFAEEHQSVVLAEDQRRPLVINYRYWGMPTNLEPHQVRNLRGLVNLVDCPPPPGLQLDGASSIDDVSPEHRPYVIARALTCMRKQLTRNCDARVCVGGRDMDPRHPERGPSGRLPGILEEAYFSCCANQPLFVSALLGGVAGQIVNALLQLETRLHFELPSAISKQYAEMEPGHSATSRAGNLDWSGSLSSTEALQYIGRTYGLERLASANRLTVEENLKLFSAASIEELTHWVLTGLCRFVREHPRRDHAR